MSERTQKQTQVEKQTIFNDRIERQKKVKLKQYCLAMSLILIQISILVALITQGQFYAEPNPVKIAYNEDIKNIFLTFLTLIGFGLLLSIYKYGSWLGGGAAIITLSIVIQLGPLLQDFFFSSVVLQFSNSPNASEIQDEIKTYWRNFQKNSISIGYQSLRYSLITVISFLTMMSAFIGRISLPQLIKLTIFFTFFWNLNFALLIKVSIHLSQNYLPVFFDTYGASFVFLFASVFGIFYNFFMFKQKLSVLHIKNKVNKFSLNLAFLGSALIFILFSLLGHLYVEFSNQCKNISFLNLQAALISSVIGTFLISSILNKGKLGFQQCIIGSFSGGILLGSSTVLMDKLGKSIAVGLGAGISSGLSMKIVGKIINKTYINDSLGLFGPVLISSLIGTFIVNPLSMVNQTIECTSSTIQGNLFATSQLIYPAITIGIGLVGGSLCGLLNIFDREQRSYGENTKFFSTQNGLILPKTFKNNEQIRINQSQWTKFSQAMEKLSEKSDKFGRPNIFSSQQLIKFDN